MELTARGRLAALAAAVLVSGTLAALPARADVKPGGFMSSNVEWVANIPLDAPGMGGRVVRVGEQTRFYVTSVKGLSIYDVTNPILPLLLGTLALPHWENEDVEVSDDGSRVIVSGERISGGKTLGVGFGPTYVIDATIPQAPVVAKVLMVGSHTVTCVDAACDWIYSSAGDIYDLRDLAAPRILRDAQGWEWQAESDVGFSLWQTAHDLNQDAAGYVITDTVPRLMLDVGDPEHPRVKTYSSWTAEQIAYQHNNLRPGAAEWTARPDSTAYRHGEVLNPGEILLANGETNLTQCDGSTNGPFATWSLKNWDQGFTMKFIDVYRPLAGLYEDGNPAVNVLGCSGHWFTERHGVVAAGWYEHGIRFLEVDNRGFISEVGFFQPVVTSAFAAYWVTDDVVYSVDFERGIDILRFDRDAPAPTQAEIDASWLAKLGEVSPAAANERFYCRLAAS